MITLDKNKFRGALLGLATGDALGTTVEFSQRGTFEPLTDIVGGGPFSLKPGEWTDDTSMTLCLVRKALENFAITDNPHSGSTDPMSAGNGSIMRLAPVPMFFAHDSLLAGIQAAESSRTTHGAKDATDACYVYAQLIIAALHGHNKDHILSPQAVIPYEQESLTPGIAAIVKGSYKDKEAIDIRGSGYVVQSLEAALWAFWNTNTFEEGALLAVNLGDDADTTGAVYGQIAGAYYGMKDIPKHWLKKLAWKDKISRLADQLYQHAQDNIHQS